MCSDDHGRSELGLWTYGLEETRPSEGGEEGGGVGLGGREWLPLQAKHLPPPPLPPIPSLLSRGSPPDWRRSINRGANPRSCILAGIARGSECWRDVTLLYCEHQWLAQFLWVGLACVLPLGTLCPPTPCHSHFQVPHPCCHQSPRARRACPPST